MQERTKVRHGDSERSVGHQRLPRQIEAIVDERGYPAGFDAAAWLAKWLTAPLPALGGAAPATLMDTTGRQALVASALAKIQSGEYVCVAR